MNKIMKTYFLPANLKKELRKVWGIPIFGKEKEVAEKFRNIAQEKKFKKIITVGDYCSLTLLSDVKIFDGKIKRKKIEKTPPFSLQCSNQAGTIQPEVWPIIKEAIGENKNVFVKGEEDLLVIPSVLLSSKKTAVVYGLYQKGICLIEVTPEIKKTLKELLKKFDISQPSLRGE
jgi:uncharacterized protein (UPF0218 family)